MKTLYIDAETREASLDEMTRTLSAMLAEGKRVAVTIAEEDEALSPNEAADRLGFSRQHVVRLINASLLEGVRLPNSKYWQVPLSSVLEFEEKREQNREKAREQSRALDELGAPAE
jgi:DNA segregation ATPase FtsK/SpoIIIE-like protein